MLPLQRVLNQVDNNLMNEVNRIERPSTTFVKIGRLLYEFLKFIESDEQKNQLAEDVSMV